MKTRILLFHLLVVIGLLMLAGVPPQLGAEKPQPPQPPPDPAIAFTAEKNFSWFDLMVMNADGSNQTRLAEGPALLVVWSPAP